jgi:CelD/BcsL family acetyltransferase involved in cellulose biosynthesis
VLPAADQHWLDVAKRCGHATFFHTPYWQRLGAAADPSQHVETASIELAGGGTAILPMVCVRRLGTRQLVSTFTGAYGGPISERRLEPQEALALQMRLRSWRTGVQIAGNPLADPLPPAPGMHAREDSSMILPLEGDFAAVQRRFTKGHRSALTKGRRSGVTVRLADSLQDYRVYFELYRRSLERWGSAASSTYGWELFAEGHRLSLELPDNIRLWLAVHERKVIAGAWVFYWNRHAIWWHGSADESAFELRPNNVLIPEIAAAALEEGYEELDMGATAGHEGPTRFKRHFGAVERPLRHLEYRPRLLDLGYAAVATARALRRSGSR